MIDRQSIRRCAIVLTVFTVWTGATAPDAKPRPGGIVVVRASDATSGTTLGPAHAPVTIEVFLGSRLRRRVRDTVHRLMELADAHPRRLRVVFRFQRTDWAANAAREAAHRGVFRKFVKTMLLRGSGFRRKRFDKAVLEAGLWDPKAPKLKASDHSRLATLDSAWRERWLRSYSSRPAIMINGRSFTSPLRSSALETAYDAAFAESTKLLDDGIPLEHLYDVLLRRVAMSRPVIDIPVQPFKGPELPEGTKSPLELRAPLIVDSDLALGPEDARAVVFVTCAPGTHRCRSLIATVTRLTRAYPQSLRIVFHPAAEPEAELGNRAALCAATTGRFWKFAQTRRRRSHRSRLKFEPASAGMTASELETCLESESTANRLKRFVRQANRADLVRHPAVAVNGRMYIAAPSFLQLRSLVDRALATPDFSQIPLPPR